eukprot:TRINITY_DN2786_c0_g1_i1.p1 TRINITY_DN2786_c0_g1~~TRINITY_DN2786_c0_g1_i1.p1  ORF type:complete len:386 (+),score=165.17 TRINITY_DN2786_c0_g1_i1:130-1287(+)
MNGHLIFLAVAMVVTGSINTISTKFADNAYSKGIDGTTRQFDHPFFQAAGMFLGELLCLGAHYVLFFRQKCQGKDPQTVKFNPAIFILPACCDLAATSSMYVGLNWTYASVFQMLRGSVVIFTGILSVIFLKRKLKLLHWSGMVFVLIGLGFVGFASIYQGGSSSSAPHPLLGDIIVIAAQVIVSVQMVVEEKFVSKYNVPPLQVVGFEGMFGLTILSGLLVAMYYIPGSSAGNHFENAPDAFVQLGNSWVVLVATLGNLLSISFFNFFGISITKYSSATTRMVLDSIRTIVIWAFSLIMKWQEFQFFQLIGFAFLLFGSGLYNEIIVLKCFGRHFIPDSKLKEMEIESDETQKLISPTDATVENGYPDDTTKAYNSAHRNSTVQ